MEPFLHCNSAMCRVTFNCLNLPVFCRAQRKAAPARRTQGRHTPAQTVQTQETDQRQQADRAAHTSLELGLACGRGCGVSLSGQAASVVFAGSFAHAAGLGGAQHGSKRNIGVRVAVCVELLQCARLVWRARGGQHTQETTHRAGSNPRKENECGASGRSAAGHRKAPTARGGVCVHAVDGSRAAWPVK